ncbi:MAG: sensor histidine kinase [Myxococcaceae bacterium]|nr:sensor histidine kinase [Myxococcaceae bacterium]
MSSRTDRWVSLAVVVVAAIEVSLRTDLPSPPVAFAYASIMATAVFFRRRAPLGAMAFGFGAANVLTFVEYAFSLPQLAPAASAAALLLPYTLARWGTRRGLIAGAALLVSTWTLTLLAGQMANLSDAIGGGVVLLFPGVVGVAVRFRSEAQARSLSQARLLERERLARELHDSVAHHLVAITVQAQAARAIMTKRPDDAATALSAIEDESRRTLAELRALVGSLRDDGEPELSPAGRLTDLPLLAQRTEKPAVDVQLEGDLEGLAPAVERAVFRLAQESITNALKHARNATRVTVRIAARGSSILLSARDDGEVATAPRRAGFGLVGMAERAALLGGTFEAGPVSGGGWQVEATLPREGRTT